MADLLWLPQRKYYRGETWGFSWLRNDDYTLDPLACMLRLGWGGRVPHEDGSARMYRYDVTLEFRLFPHLVWNQVYLGTERGEPVYNMIVTGYRSWPFYFDFIRPKGEQT